MAVQAYRKKTLGELEAEFRSKSFCKDTVHKPLVPKELKERIYATLGTIESGKL